MAEYSKDYEKVSLELVPFDRFILWYCTIGTVLFLLFFNYMTTFEGVWIAGMPKSAFFVVVVGFVNIAIALVSRHGYKSHYDKILK